MSFLSTILSNIIEEDIPRKYKRLTLIYTLIQNVNKDLKICDSTIKKIEMLFKTGIITFKELSITKLLSMHIWSEMTKNTVVEISGTQYTLNEAVDYYNSHKGNKDVQTLCVLKMTDAIYKHLPEYMKYESERKIRNDIYGVFAYSDIKDLEMSRI